MGTSSQVETKTQPETLPKSDIRLVSEPRNEKVGTPKVELTKLPKPDPRLVSRPREGT